MGNVVSNNSSGLLDDSPLGNYVKRWAIKNYKPNPSIALHSKKDTLKKRACCTGQPNVYFPLPGVDPGKKTITVAVGVPIFDSKASMLQQKCLFTDDRGVISSHFFKTDDGGNVYSDDPGCKSFYTEFCKGVRNNRMLYPKEDQKSYGLDPDQKDGFVEDYQVNPYIDCNCENSIYKTKFDLVQQESPMLDADTLAQTLDTRCAAQSDRTYKPSIKKMANLCFNYVNIKYIDLSDDATFGLNQSCNVQSGGPGGTPTPVINRVEVPTCKDQFIQQTPGSTLKIPNPDFNPNCKPKAPPQPTGPSVDTTLADNRKLYFVIGGIGFILLFMIMMFVLSSKGKKQQFDYPDYPNYSDYQMMMPQQAQYYYHPPMYQ